jgi:hypothetical protein
VGDPARTSRCSVSVYYPCGLSGRIVIESMSLFGHETDMARCPDLSPQCAPKRTSARVLSASVGLREDAFWH